MGKKDVRGLIISVVVCVVVLGAIMFYATIDSRAKEGEAKEASARIENALKNIPLTTNKGTMKNKELLPETYDYIEADLDFDKILIGNDVKTDDFATAQGIETAREDFLNELKDEIVALFTLTKKFTVRVSNLDTLDRYFKESIEGMKKDGFELPIELRRFLKSGGSPPHEFRENVDFKVIIAEYGDLHISSNFFKEYKDEAHSMRIVFSPKTAEENPIVSMRVLDEGGNELPIQNPGAAFDLTIPFSSKLMKDLGGKLAYDRMEYISPEDAAPEELQYKTTDKKLHVRAEKSGSYRLGSIDEEATRKRINDAIDKIKVQADNRSYNLGEFRDVNRKGYDYINVTIDFDEILSDIDLFDYLAASQQADYFIEELRALLSLLFNKANRLLIKERNEEKLDDFLIVNGLGGDQVNSREFSIDISDFIDADNKSAYLETGFGSLTMGSSFFRADWQPGEPLNETRSLRLALEDEVAPTLSVAFLGANNEEHNAQHPAKSLLLTIPLSSPIMNNEQGEPYGYDAIEYISSEGDEGGVVQGILPRSFIDGDNLCVYANRTGRFRLAKTDNGSTSDRADFLSNRGINLRGFEQEDGEAFITRGDFWCALMDIHWIEGIFQPPTEERQFPDLEPSTKLNDQIWVGKRLEMFPLRGYPDGNFAADSFLQRDHLISMLAAYIKGFQIEVDGLKPFNAEVVLPEGFESHWSFNAYNDLKSIGFIPYSPNDTGTLELAANVTLQEARDLLYTLITVNHSR